jgi:hypothetical protein
MDALSTIFGSEARVKIMRLFLFNVEDVFDIDMVCRKSKVSYGTGKKEISTLEKIKFVKRKKFIKIVQKKKGKKIKDVRVKYQGYYLNEDFPYIVALKHLLIKTDTLEGGEIIKRLSKTGKLKLIVVAGVFTQDKNSRADILVVGNGINKSALNNVIRSIESELGKELTYVCFETEDFQYRLSMFDKLVRDILDYPHQVLLDKISL